MEIIAVSQNKGGTGKTSVTTNIAGILSREYDKKILIVDTDAQSNVVLSFGHNPDKYEGKSIYEVLLGKVKVKDALVNVAYNIDVIPSTSEMNFFEFDVLTHLDQYHDVYRLLSKSIEPVIGNYDYVLIDTPPSLSLTTINAFVLADSILIPYEPEFYSAKGLMRICKAIQDISGKQNPNLEIYGVIANKVDHRTKLHREMINQARDFCKRNQITMFNTTLPKSVNISNAVAQYGMPLTLIPITKDNKWVYESYKNLIKEMLSK